MLSWPLSYRRSLQPVRTKHAHGRARLRRNGRWGILVFKELDLDGIDLESRAIAIDHRTSQGISALNKRADEPQPFASTC